MHVVQLGYGTVQISLASFAKDRCVKYICRHSAQHVLEKCLNINKKWPRNPQHKLKKYSVWLGFSAWFNMQALY